MRFMLIIRARGVRRAAREAARAGEWQTAVRLYRGLVTQGIATPRDMVQLAHGLKEAGDAAGAGEAYRAAAAAFPLHADAQLHYGLFLQQLRRHGEATNALARTLAMDPENAFVRTKLADLGIGEEGMDMVMLNGILAGYDAVRPRGGTATRLAIAWHLRQARRHARARQWNAAAARYRRIVSLDPHNARALVQLGHVLRKQGDAGQAVAAYRRALIIGPRHPDTYLHLGHALKTIERRPAALKAYMAALRLQPDLPPAVAELKSLGWGEADLASAEAGQGGFGSDSQKGLIPPLSNLNMPLSLTRRQQSIWMLLAAHADRGN